MDSYHSSRMNDYHFRPRLSKVVPQARATKHQHQHPPPAAHAPSGKLHSPFHDYPLRKILILTWSIARVFLSSQVLERVGCPCYSSNGSRAGFKYVSIH